MSKMLPNSKSSPTTGLISKSNIFLLVVLFVVIGVSFFNDFVEIETVQSPCPTPPPPPGQPQNIIAKRQSALPGQVCLSSVYGCFNWQSLTKTDEERMAVSFNSKIMVFYFHILLFFEREKNFFFVN